MVDISAAARLGSQRFLAKSQEIFDEEADKFECYYLNNITSLRVEVEPTSSLEETSSASAPPTETEDAVDDEIGALLLRLKEAERRRAEVEGVPSGPSSSSSLLDELRATRSDILSSAWHSKWAEELQMCVFLRLSLSHLNALTVGSTTDAGCSWANSASSAISKTPSEPPTPRCKPLCLRHLVHPVHFPVPPGCLACHTRLKLKAPGRSELT